MQVFILVSYIHLLFCHDVKLSPQHLVIGPPSSHSTKHARWLVVITTSQVACFSPGSATIKAGSPPTRYASMSGTPCRTCNHTVLILQCSSLKCRYPDHMECFFFFNILIFFLPFFFLQLFSRKYDHDVLLLVLKD